MTKIHSAASVLASTPRSLPDSSFGRVLAGSADALLLFSPALGLAKSIPLDFPWSATDIVSATTRAGFEPSLNYVQFGLCALIVWIAFGLGYWRGQSLLECTMRIFSHRLNATRGAAFGFLAIGTAVLLIYLANVGTSAIAAPLTDLFHEGEYLGFVPALHARGSVLAEAFTVHGPGVDLFPGLVATTVGLEDRGIVIVRGVYSTQRFLAVVAAFAVQLILATLVLHASTWRGRFVLALVSFLILVTALQAGAWPDELALHKTLNTRDLIFLTQIAAVLAFVQAQANLHRKRMGLALAAVCGALLPFGIVYSYDRGLYGAAFFGLASIAIASCGGKWGRNWLLGFGAGLAIAAPIVFLIIGNAGLQALIDQLAFWILYGRMIWAFPGLSTISSSWSGVLLIGSFIAMALAAARLYEALMVSRRVGDAVRQELPSLILVAASIASARMAIERGDPGHVAWGTTASWILLSIYIGKFVMDAVGPSPGASRVPAIADSAMPGRPMVFLAMSALIGWNLTLLNPYSAFIALHRGYATSLRTTDKAILSQGQTETVDAMRTQVSDSRCFYTMTNESAWHYLLGKESCSRFYQITNARASVTQEEVVASLKDKRPSHILFSSTAWSNRIDGISVFNANQLVVRHVLTHFVPDRFIAGNWFWRRSDVPLSFSNSEIGVLTKAPVEGTRRWDLAVNGMYRKQTLAAFPEGILVTIGDDNVPVWAGRLDLDEFVRGEWSALIPTAALSPGKHRVRIWAMRGEGTAMPLVGEIRDLQIR